MTRPDLKAIRERAEHLSHGTYEDKKIAWEVAPLLAYIERLEGKLVEDRAIITALVDDDAVLRNPTPEQENRARAEIEKELSEDKA